MVFYFSGTGNSKYVAEKIGQRLNVSVEDVSKYF